MQVRCQGDTNHRGQTETHPVNIFGLKDAEIDSGICRKGREIYGCGGREASRCERRRELRSGVVLEGGDWMWLNLKQTREGGRDALWTEVGVESCCLFGSTGKKTRKVMI